MRENLHCLQKYKTLTTGKLTAYMMGKNKNIKDKYLQNINLQKKNKNVQVHRHYNAYAVNF